MMDEMTEKKTTMPRATHMQWFTSVLSGLWLCLGVTWGQTPAVVINEILYEPAPSTEATEFVELYNAGTSAVDLVAWTLDGGITYTFPPGTLLTPGAYVVVAEAPASLKARFAVNALGPFEGLMDAGGDEIVLRDAAGLVVDRVAYGLGFPWPTDTEGRSIELIHPGLDNDLGGSWRACGSIAGDTRVAEPPATLVPKASDQWQYRKLTSTDLLYDAELVESTPPTAPPSEGPAPTPGARNSVYAVNAPPQIGQVQHLPGQPTSGQPIVVTAEVTDPNDVGQVGLSYQIVLPGQYIPAYLPLTKSEMDTVPTPWPPPNPAYSDALNWVTVSMYDDGTHGDALAGDAIYTAVLHPQAHRTLVRYRIAATDRAAKPLSVTVPYDDDTSLNFACFVYDGVPSCHDTPQEVMANTVPVYHLLARYDDYLTCQGYRSEDRLSQGSPAWFLENWWGTIVYEGKVYDHIRYRLRGGDDRYGNENKYNTKRSMVFRFNRGLFFEARDGEGRPFEQTWRTLTTYKGIENRNTLTYGLNEAVNYHLWNLIGVPSPRAFHFQLRLIATGPEQADAWHGDFQGLFLASETYDLGFLKQHNLADGNLYTLVNSTDNALEQESYQAPQAVTDGSDYRNIQDNLPNNRNDTFIANHVRLPEWYSYQALCHAFKHYDFWPGKAENAAWYFEPNYVPENNFYGPMWTLPWDTDGTWGPVWSDLPDDRVYEAVFSGEATSALKIPYYNAVREVYDLIWQTDQLTALIRYYGDRIQPLIAADRDRWLDAPSDVGTYVGLGGPGVAHGLYGPGPGTVGLEGYAEDMIRFAFLGGKSWPGDSGLQAARTQFLLELCDGYRGQNEGASIPNTPTLDYTGDPSHPINDLRFASSAFSDPQGAETFAALQWRVAEISAAGAPGHDPNRPPILEVAPVWQSPEITDTATLTVSIPTDVAKAGLTYRVRVRMKDNTGRWSHWSLPVQFVADSAPNNSVVINEVLAHSHASDPDWIELYNTADAPVPIGGWFLSDDPDDPNRYRIAADTVIQAKGYVVFYENLHFGNPLDSGCRTPFGLSEIGDSVCLTSPQVGGLAGYRVQEDFGPSETGVSFGRYTKASTATTNFVAMTFPTPDAANAGPKVGPVVISEIMYNPAGNDDAEYVELLNISQGPVTLYDAAIQVGWRFADDTVDPGLDLILAGTSDILLGPGQVMVLVKDRADFLSAYTVPSGTQIVQWPSGKLSNSGEKLELAKGVDLDSLGHISYVRIDRVNFSDGSHPVGEDPWPAGADGLGPSLTRIDVYQYGNDPANWKAAQPTPGRL